MQYSIGAFSALVDLSIHTLRYYEKEGLLNPVRDNGNRRCYTEKDVAWLLLIKRLKDTGMPIKEIQFYARLREMGTPTLAERMALLEKHRNVLKEEIAAMQEHLSKLDEKIAHYRNEIAELTCK